MIILPRIKKKLITLKILMKKCFKIQINHKELKIQVHLIKISRQKDLVFMEQQESQEPKIDLLRKMLI